MGSEVEPSGASAKPFSMASKAGGLSSLEDRKSSRPEQQPLGTISALQQNWECLREETQEQTEVILQLQGAVEELQALIGRPSMAVAQAPAAIVAPAADAVSPVPPGAIQLLQERLSRIEQESITRLSEMQVKSAAQQAEKENTFRESIQRLLAEHEETVRQCVGNVEALIRSVSEAQEQGWCDEKHAREHSLRQEALTREAEVSEIRKHVAQLEFKLQESKGRVPLSGSDDEDTRLTDHLVQLTEKIRQVQDQIPAKQAREQQQIAQLDEERLVRERSLEAIRELVARERVARHEEQQALRSEFEACVTALQRHQERYDQANENKDDAAESIATITPHSSAAASAIVQNSQRPLPPPETLYSSVAMASCAQLQQQISNGQCLSPRAAMVPAVLTPRANQGAPSASSSTTPARLTPQVGPSPSSSPSLPLPFSPQAAQSVAVSPRVHPFYNFNGQIAENSGARDIGSRTQAVRALSPPAPLPTASLLSASFDPLSPLVSMSLVSPAVPMVAFPASGMQQSPRRSISTPKAAAWSPPKQQAGHSDARRSMSRDKN